jgi:hypothetical protein
VPEASQTRYGRFGSNFHVVLSRETQVPPLRLFSSTGLLRVLMQEAKTYRQYAAECRRMAKTMKEVADRKALLQIAEAWEKQAQEAERLEKKS